MRILGITAILNGKFFPTTEAKAPNLECFKPVNDSPPFLILKVCTNQNEIILLETSLKSNTQKVPPWFFWKVRSTSRLSSTASNLTCFICTWMQKTIQNPRIPANSSILEPVAWWFHHLLQPQHGACLDLGKCRTIVLLNPALGGNRWGYLQGCHQIQYSGLKELGMSRRCCHRMQQRPLQLSFLWRLWKPKGNTYTILHSSKCLLHCTLSSPGKQLE